MDQAEIVERLQTRTALPPLAPSTIFDAELREAIRDLGAGALIATALHVLNDDLDLAHPQAQSLEGDPTADYWHAIIHRREGDYSNARYWVSRVGGHPVVLEIHGSPAEAARFVGDCRSAVVQTRRALEEKQWLEMIRLLDYTLNKKRPSA